MSRSKSTATPIRRREEIKRGSGFILMWKLMGGQKSGQPRSITPIVVETNGRGPRLGPPTGSSRAESVLVLVIALVIAAFTVGMAGPAATWTTTLVPVSEVSGAIAGTAELDSIGPAASTARISIRGDRPGAIRPWHVHHGRCGQDGAVLGSASDYPPVKIGQDGTGTATATLKVATPAAGDYLINVHASATDLQTIVACGDLQTSGK